MKSKREREEEQINREALGKMADFMMDISKLVFAGIIIGGIMDLSLDKESLFIGGLIVILLLLVFWYILFRRSKRKA